ncbi:MAG: isoleucine--tRNA ligase [Gammaproteobacteria bacterium]|nr:isoleucine--tRNA ligase [Gammaproteobacteria bacterium]
MSDYKSTLNLPRTDFPMKANLAQREPEIIKKWEEMNLYQKIREQNKGLPHFILLDGPIYANGHIHMGHALNRTLKDIVVKAKTFSGFDAPFIPGWDCHGLPIELNVEKKIGKSGHKVTAEAFRKACREYADSFIAIQRDEFKRLGLQADWARLYTTMDFSFEADIIRSLAEVVKNGHLQKGYKPVYWCLDCGSALAEAEVEYADKVSSAIDVSFQVVDTAEFLKRFENAEKGAGSIAIPIWTTTPWTLPANQAVALNPELDYVLVEVDAGSQLVIAEQLLETVMLRFGHEKYRVLGKVKGKALEGVQLQHPFYSRVVPVILGEHVTVESGTGAVHTAPAHGVDDYQVGKRYNLPIENPVGDDGCFIATTELFAGLHVNKANERIIEVLREKNVLLHFAKLTHSYPHCWRHKTPLIFRSTPQWFISMDKQGLRAEAMKSIDRVEWIPDWGKSRIASMIENRPDWCISRQRTWGVPIALFIHTETDEIHPNTIEIMEKVANLVAKAGVDAWYTLDPKDILGDDAKHYKKCTDILDVWFDSGVTHECVLKKWPELDFPADLYLEGSDQHRGWFQSSLLTSIAINGHEPFKTVLTHGYVVDGQGRKMSKSIGNVVAPDKIIQTLGADVLRLWVSSIDYRSEITVSDEILTRNSETYRRLRNTARFFLANLDGFDPEKHLVKPDEMLALDRWAVDRTRQFQEEILKAYDAYQFHIIYQKIHHFCAIDMGSFYLDIIKDRQYTTQTNSLARRSAQTAMFHIIESLVRWMAPILSFTAEEIWQYIPGKRNESVFLNRWYTDLQAMDANAEMNQAYWEKMQLIRNAVNKEIENQRNAGLIGSALEADVKLYCEPALKQQVDLLGNDLRFVLITSGAEVLLAGNNTADLVATEVPGLWLKVTPLTFAKCERCWHRLADVGRDVKHPGLCGRCIVNVDGAGEVRLYA